MHQSHFNTLSVLGRYGHSKAYCANNDLFYRLSNKPDKDVPMYVSGIYQNVTVNLCYKMKIDRSIGNFIDHA